MCVCECCEQQFCCRRVWVACCVRVMRRRLCVCVSSTYRFINVCPSRTRASPLRLCGCARCTAAQRACELSHTRVQKSRRSTRAHKVERPVGRSVGLENAIRFRNELLDARVLQAQPPSTSSSSSSLPMLDGAVRLRLPASAASAATRCATLRGGVVACV